MKYPKLRELGEAIKAAFLGPYTSKFPKEAHVPHPNFRGQPVFDSEKCVGCLGCEEICPVDAIAHEDIVDADPPIRRMIHYTDTCIFCGMCEDACINDNQGIVLGSEWELSYFDRKQSFETIEKELQLCEVCGVVIATKDHLVLLAEKLGEMAYSNPTIYLARLEALGAADPNLIPVLRDQGRSDRIKILCARCRRETTLYPEEGE